jgi:hypothetical protein
MKAVVPIDLCKEVLALDKSIRYAGIADRSDKIVSEEYRKGMHPLISKEVAEFSVMHAAERMRGRILLRPYLGRPIYSFTLYEKVKRSTIPLEGDNFILMVSFDVEADHEKLILKKIFPLLSRHGLWKASKTLV